MIFLSGEVWSRERIKELKQDVESHGLNLSVIESVPVHEDIKLGKDTRDHYIENYKTTIRNLAKAGVKTVCYNFMPVFDWTRTDLAKPLEDGSNSLNYDEEELKELDPLSGELTLPGWDLSYQTDELKRIMEEYKQITEDQLLDNLVYFLEQIIPVAEEEDVLMAIHPDDPPWNIFGLPRVVKNKENIKYLLDAVDSPNNGLTFCTGSFGADPSNDLFEIIDTAQGRINFVHLRNVKRYGEQSFQEVSHMNKDGSLDMVGIIKKLKETGFNGPARPDHGRMIFGEEGRPGYGLYDRALGAMYIAGVLDSIK